MKRPLAYITAAWYGGDTENAEVTATTTPVPAVRA